MAEGRRGAFLCRIDHRFHVSLLAKRSKSHACIRAISLGGDCFASLAMTGLAYRSNDRINRQSHNINFRITTSTKAGCAVGRPQRHCKANAVEAEFAVRIDHVWLRRPCAIRPSPQDLRGDRSRTQDNDLRHRRDRRLGTDIRPCLANVGRRQNFDQHDGLMQQSCAGGWCAGDAEIGNQAVRLGTLRGDDAGSRDNSARTATRSEMGGQEIVHLRLDRAVWVGRWSHHLRLAVPQLP
jgi:hypothetical protein